MTAGGFQVVRSDLLSASGTFAAEAGTFKAIMPDEGPARPDGGDAAFNDSLQSVVQAVGLLHLQFAGELDSHAARLKQAHDTYAGTEQNLIQRIGQITTSSPAG